MSGPFVFGDLPGWAGSYTMDYNTEQLYAPMYGSGRGSLASAYFRMLMDYTPLARRNAAYCAFSPDSIRIVFARVLKILENSSLNSRELTRDDVMDDVHARDG